MSIRVVRSVYMSWAVRTHNVRTSPLQLFHWKYGCHLLLPTPHGSCQWHKSSSHILHYSYYMLVPNSDKSLFSCLQDERR